MITVLDKIQDVSPVFFRVLIYFDIGKFKKNFNLKDDV